MSQEFERRRVDRPRDLRRQTAAETRGRNADRRPPLDPASRYAAGHLGSNPIHDGRFFSGVLSETRQTAHANECMLGGTCCSAQKRL